MMSTEKSKKERGGGGGVAGFENSINASTKRLEDCIKNAEDVWLQRPETNTEKHKHQCNKKYSENESGKKNNCMGISIDKQTGKSFFFMSWVWKSKIVH